MLEEHEFSRAARPSLRGWVPQAQDVVTMILLSAQSGLTINDVQSRRPAKGDPPSCMIPPGGTSRPIDRGRRPIEWSASRPQFDPVYS